MDRICEKHPEAEQKHNTNGYWICTQCRRDNVLRHHAKLKTEDPEAWRAYRKRTRDNRIARHRAAVFALLGDRCVCCGQTRQVFLCIDHKNGDGAADRKKYTSRDAWYSAIIRNPQDSLNRLQILCHNCNMAKELEVNHTCSCT